MNMKIRCAVVAACAAVLGLATQSARASFHFMQVEQIIGGVDGDATAQAIQLRMRLGFQNQVQNSRLFARDAAGANPVLLATFTGPVANNAAGSHVLIASANFAAHTSPALVADRTMTALIPASYLPAGSLTFEDLGGTVLWRVSWGGEGYTGDTTGAPTNDDDGDFGKLTAALPSSNLQAFRFTGVASAQSVANETDYALTAGAAVFTNNAGAAFTLVGAGSPNGDLDGSGLADGRDIYHFVECVLSGSTTGGTCPPADFDSSGGVNANDVAPFIAALLGA